MRQLPVQVPGSRDYKLRTLREGSKEAYVLPAASSGRIGR